MTAPSISPPAFATKESAKRLVRALLPLGLRKRCAIWLDRQSWLASGRWWAVQLLADFAERDADGYHRFLWSHHMAYAESYDVEARFGSEKIHRTRQMLFDDLLAHLGTAGRGSALDIRSVFEVGCSLGYLLRHVETTIFSRAERIEGIDVDEQAVYSGAAYLRRIGSKVRLHAGDVDRLEELLENTRYDLILCCGVLMYLSESKARRVVSTMLEHARVVAISGLAHPEIDNAELAGAEIRRRDGTFIHNVDAMVEAAGGRIDRRRWEGGRMVDGNTVYFLFCSGRGATQGSDG